jgi:glycosyltransferase involved in cell wall biosynthesis
LLSDCTVAAFPSYVEGFGLAIIEQLAAGIPAVAYAAPGPRDILQDSLPELLVAPGDVARFSETISEIFEKDPSAYRDISNRSAETAARFSWPQIARETVEEYGRRLNELAMASSDANS